MKTISSLMMSLLMTGVAEAQFPLFHRNDKHAENTKSLTEDTTSVTINYRTRRDLLIVPAIINDTVRVNLIVDPRCQTLILFGKKYEKQLKKSKTALYSDVPRNHHKVEIGPAMREDVPIVVVRNIDPMNFFIGINGVIGSEMMAACDIEFDHRNQRMTMKVLDHHDLSAQAFDRLPVKPFFESTLPYRIQKFYSAPMIYRAMGRVSER